MMIKSEGLMQIIRSSILLRHCLTQRQTACHSQMMPRKRLEIVKTKDARCIAQRFLFSETHIQTFYNINQW